jgi:hypothetical protein
MGHRGSQLRVIVTGLIADYPLGGMAWHYLQYVLGMARLGHDVFYLEDSGRDPYNPVEGGPSAHCRYNAPYLAELMARFGLERRWAYRSSIDGRWYGMSDERRREMLETADLLINISGSLECPDAYRGVPRLAYVDTDPAFTQLKLLRNHARFAARVDAHDVHFSFGELIGGALQPTGHRWRPTRQPVVLAEWRPSTQSRNVYTTVMSWTSYRSETYAGQVYGHKDLEFERFLDLPTVVAPIGLEIAIAPGRAGGMPSDLLARAGWRIVDPNSVCPDLDGYRTYIESSKAEWSVAKNAYVQARSGWFSERSACYLAAGRPVVLQDTGFSGFLPTGEGILSFETFDEAVAALRDVQGNYRRHARAALALADEYFDSDKVLTRLIESALASETSEPATAGGPSGRAASV